MAKIREKRLFIDQHGNMIWASTVRELRDLAGGGRVSRMYRDRPGPNGIWISVHAGYVIGNRWFSEFARVERPI